MADDDDKVVVNGTVSGITWADEFADNYNSAIRALKDWSMTMELATNNLSALQRYFDAPIRGHTPGGLTYTIRPSVLGEIRGHG